MDDRWLDEFASDVEAIAPTPIYDELAATHGASGFAWFEEASGPAADTQPNGEVQSAVFREATPEHWVGDGDMAAMAVWGEVIRHEPGDR